MPGHGKEITVISLVHVIGCAPALARLMCLAGPVEHYGAAPQGLNEHSSLALNSRRIPRMVERLRPQMAQ
jgi:hypothetical protein